MRDLPTISTLWGTSNGVFLGDNKPHGRVTVEPSWTLTTTPRNYGASDMGPYRYYFDASQAQYPNASEVEVPNVKSINISRSIDQDAATCTIEVYNQWMDDNDTAGDSPNVLGNPGYLGPTYGTSPEASGIFGQTANTWEDVLVPNAMLRTYQGYGGYTNGVPDALGTAVTNGNIAITGVWLIDSVTTGTNGLLVLSCRDMAKLLVDQMLFEPLTPSHFTPMKYCRFVREDREAVVNEGGGGTPGTPSEPPPTAAAFSPTYQDSSMDRWCISNPLYGHYFEAASDGDPSTSSWSQGVIHPTRIFARAFWQFQVDAEINEIRVNACRNSFGNLWISVRENGSWQGDARIPWDDNDNDGYSDSLAAGQPNSQPCRPMNVDIRYVWQGSVGNEPVWIRLPRTYNAQRIRLTTNQSWNSGLGPFPYRACLQEVRCRLSLEGTEGEPEAPTAVDDGVPPDFDALAAQYPDADVIETTDGGIVLIYTDPPQEEEFVPGYFEGGLFTPAITPATTVWHDGNVFDWVEIVRDMLLWSGFLYYTGASPSGEADVHGLLQFSGTYPEECVNEDFFAKKPVMQAINEIKDTLGYVFFIDEEGGVRFQMPNWYYPGNVLGDGTRTTNVYELYDELTITEYQSQFDDTSLASEIIVGSLFPPTRTSSDEESSTATSNYTRFNPTAAEGPLSGFDLRGMTRPIIWVNEIWERPSEQRISAALLGVHALFNARKGNVTVLANPEFQLGDQVRITERTTAESYIHMIRSIDSRMDLDTGEYLMSLTTNWLGEEGNWVIDSEFLLNEMGGVFDLSNIDLGQELAYGDPNLPPETEPTDPGGTGAGD